MHSWRQQLRSPSGPLTSLRAPVRAVSRFVCHSDLYEMDLHIDINTDLFPLQARQQQGERTVGRDAGLHLNGCAPHRHTAASMEAARANVYGILGGVMQRNDKFSLVLAWTLNLDATPGSDKYDAVGPWAAAPGAGAATATCNGGVSLGAQQRGRMGRVGSVLGFWGWVGGDWAPRRDLAV